MCDDCVEKEAQPTDPDSGAATRPCKRARLAQSVIPVVDLALKDDLVVPALDAAARNVGFLAIVSHGIEAEAISRAFVAAKEFFALSEEQKLQCAAENGAYGFFPRAASADDAGLPDLREDFAMGPPGGLPKRFTNNSAAMGSTNVSQRVLNFCYGDTPWSSHCRKLKKSFEPLYAALTELGERLLSLFSQALALESTFFASGTDGHCNTLRAIHYFGLDDEVPPPSEQHRCGPHYDTGTLTLLVQDRPGLEIQLPGQEEWHPVQGIPEGSILVNIGDLMQRVSKDVWTSTFHRVPVPSTAEERCEARHSIVLFQILAADCIVEGLPPQGEYLMQHFDSMN